MVCKNCGFELNPKDKKCSKCGVSVEDADKIQITYEDEETEYVDPPVITEAHTFIDEESFAKKINEINLAKQKEEQEEKKNPFVWIFAVFVFLIVGSVFYFVIYPNITLNKNTVEDNLTFTSENWWSGEFMIDGDFYRLDKDFTQFYNRNWNLLDADFMNERLSGLEETDDLILTNSFNDSYRISIRLRNPSRKELLVKNSNVCFVSLDNTKMEDQIEFTLPGNIKNGSSLLEIESIYGPLDEENIIDDETYGLKFYHYSNDSITLDLSISDTGGLEAFEYVLK